MSLAIAIGPEHFDALLAGAYRMDQHFRHTEPLHNMPLILALLGIWYINFFDAQSHASFPYAHDLRSLSTYLQQLDMESNGKSVTKSGRPVTYATAPIHWGQVGSINQHGFCQLLHQGTHWVPVDFIIPRHTHSTDHKQHALLVKSGFAQAQALMEGSRGTDQHHPHGFNAGNRPSSILSFDKLTPERLGALMALYEHKIFAQGVIWDINSFDQFGVALSKTLLQAILQPTEPLTSGIE